jgi:hypothetical protein
MHIPAQVVKGYLKEQNSWSRLCSYSASKWNSRQGPPHVCHDSCRKLPRI